MFNLHIGVPGVIPDLLHTVVRSGVVKANKDPQILSRKLWQKHYRSLINAKQRETLQNVVSWNVAEAIFSEMSMKGPIAGSQHAILGKMEDCFLNERAFPQTEARIEKLKKLFSATPIVYHLTIQSQFDYLLTAYLRDPKKLNSAENFFIPSWAQLVERIKLADPASKVFVWDLEQPSRVLLFFLISLLDITGEDQIITLKELLKKELSTHFSYASGQEIPDFLRALSHRLDDQYEHDLEAIGRLTGVSLTLSDSVPVEFHF